MSQHIDAVRKYFESIADDYGFLDESPEGVFWRNSDISLLLDFIPSTRELCLDLGCGNGLYAARFAPYFEVTIGMDISHRMLTNAIRLTRDHAGGHPLYFIETDVHQGLQSISRPASFVLSTGCALCYFGELKDYLRAIYDVLAPQGMLAIQLWNKAGTLLAARNLSTSFKSLSEALLQLDKSALLRYLETSETVEAAFGQEVQVYSHEPNRVIDLLGSLGYSNIRFLGRKILSTLLPPATLAAVIDTNPAAVQGLERVLCLHEICATVAPSVFYLAEKGSV